MSSPAAWDLESEEVILRDGDLEEPPVFTSGHDAFLATWAEYNGDPDDE